MTASRNAPVSDREAAEMAEWLKAQEGKKETVVAAPVTIPSGMFLSVISFLDLLMMSTVLMDEAM